MGNVKVWYLLLCAIISLLSGYFGGELLYNSDSALSHLISVFSILAGVLIAVISIIGDPSMLIPGNWRSAYEHAQDVQNKIANYSDIFSIYTLSLILLVLSSLFKDNNLISLYLVFNLAAGFSTLGLLLSLPLPYSLMQIQKDRMSEEIKHRKERGKKNEPKSS